MASKTFSVLKFQEKINWILAHTDNKPPEVRIALASVLESVLCETGNYSGFAYLGQGSLDDIDRYYAALNANGHDSTHAAVEAARKAAFGDESKRFYYIHRNLKPKQE